MVCSYELDPSRALDIPTIAGLWTGAGGNAEKAITMVAIACAESKGDPLASSGPPYCATGLWQITPPNFGPYTMGQVWNGHINAAIAVQMSQNGTYYSPWDTAYNTEANAAQRYPLYALEPYSPAALAVAEVAATLGASPPGVSPGGPGLSPGFPGGIAVAPSSPQPGPSTDTVLPYSPIYAPVPYLPIVPQLYQHSDGWDNLNQLIGYDTAALISFDAALRNAILFPNAIG